MRAGFRSLKKAEGMWNPTRDPEGNPRAVADDNDFVEGYYTGKRTIQVPGQGDSTIYELRAEDGSPISFWGTTVLKDQMAQVKPGQFICVVWLGKVRTKAAANKPEKQLKSTDTYHSWEVLVHESKRQDIVSTEVNQSETEAIVNAGSVMASASNDGTEDLPF